MSDSLFIQSLFDEREKQLLSFQNKIEKYKSLTNDRIIIHNQYIYILNDKRQFHNENGPAVEWFDGVKEYWLENKKYTEEEYWKIINEK